MYFHGGAQFKEHTNDYIAAGGHFGSKSSELVKHYVSDLGFRDRWASHKSEFITVADEFLSHKVDASMVLECFTTASDESNAYKLINTIDAFWMTNTPMGKLKSLVPEKIKNVVKELVK